MLVLDVFHKRALVVYHGLRFVAQCVASTGYLRCIINLEPGDGRSLDPSTWVGRKLF